MDQTDSIVRLSCQDGIARITLNDPAKRNAMGLALFHALEEAMSRIVSDNSVRVVLLNGEGPAFCAGFDLPAAASDASLIAQYIERLSVVIRTLRRMPAIVVAAVHGPAIAGGCALLTACDFVVVSPTAKLGYPVHRLGLSPAVTIPTLSQMIGGGSARALLMSGELIDGQAALRLGLATRISRSSETTLREAESLCDSLIAKGANAMRATKQWLNKLDGSLDDLTFDNPARASAHLAAGIEAQAMLRRWVHDTSRTSPHKQ